MQEIQDEVDHELYSSDSTGYGDICCYNETDDKSSQAGSETPADSFGPTSLG